MSRLVRGTALRQLKAALGHGHARSLTGRFLTRDRHRTSQIGLAPSINVEEASTLSLIPLPGGGFMSDVQL